jgi:F0F1-type ATP synthase alpha subunit
MDRELDKETKEQVKKGKEIEKLVDSKGWKMAKQKLLDDLIDLDSIRGLTNEDLEKPEKLGMNLKARKTAIDIVLDWIHEIEGDAEKSKDNRQMLEQGRKGEIITRN